MSPGDGGMVRDVLASARADGDALRDGRVFVGRRRVLDGAEAVRAGDVVEIAPPAPLPGPPIHVLLETPGLVAVDKPAGVPTIPDHGGAAHALLQRTAEALGVPAASLHPTSRLDRDVSGVVVFARTAAAATALRRARDAGSYERRYVALAAAAPSPDQGTWDAPIGRAADPRRRRAGGRDPVPATTRYRLCARAAASPASAALLAVAPITGRTHQIRVHAAHAGAPLLGDPTYGGPARVTLPGGRVLGVRRVALHAARVSVADERGAPFVPTSPVPGELRDLWSALGGDDDAWQRAVTCALS